MLAGGTKGKRYSLPNSEIMIHQVLGGSSGQATDVEIHTKHLLATKKRINTLLAKSMDKEVEWVQNATERDNFLTPEKAKEYGIIDQIFHKRKG